jgi:excisionase family DNA binding protein
VKRTLQTATAEPEQPLGHAHSPYLTTDELAVYLRFDSTKQLYDWLRTNPLPRRRRGKRVLLFLRRDVDAYLAR